MTTYKCTSCQFESAVPMSQCPRCSNFGSFTAIVPPPLPGEIVPAPYRPPGSPPLDAPPELGGGVPGDIVPELGGGDDEESTVEGQ